MNYTKTSEMTKMAICIALMCVSAYIAVPVPFSATPITAQTLVINMIALVLTPKKAGMCIAAYLLIGICGIPVFSQGMSGIGVLMGPSGGYILGAVPAVMLIGKVKGSRPDFRRYMAAAIIGIPVMYLCGMVTMRIYLEVDIKSLILISTLPYVPGDLLKCAAAAYIGCALNKVLDGRNK